MFETFNRKKSGIGFANGVSVVHVKRKVLIEINAKIFLRISSADCGVVNTDIWKCQREIVNFRHFFGRNKHVFRFGVVKCEVKVGCV